VVVTLHVACKMPSLLEICFSAQQLRFAMDYRELCVETKSMPHDKYFGSHDLHTLPRYQFGGILFSFWTMSQLGL
jgi:hypothetical protein